MLVHRRSCNSETADPSVEYAASGYERIKGAWLNVVRYHSLNAKLQGQPYETLCFPIFLFCHRTIIIYNCILVFNYGITKK
jgi:hypothetical protein